MNRRPSRCKRKRGAFELLAFRNNFLKHEQLKKNARWSEAEGADAEWVKDIDAAISKAEQGND